ncbi:hypothetical protein PR048_012267 [Dryococelus australis]|uniref:Uncharacterized protein n=1 Tax=Dryococelus australis TaxID=614101 RepID=A0ABQ9HP19_9NEOP|nr:hypothetical protein PR048_012267 [Dryococelus australis]
MIDFGKIQYGGRIPDLGPHTLRQLAQCPTTYVTNGLSSVGDMIIHDSAAGCAPSVHAQYEVIGEILEASWHIALVAPIAAVESLLPAWFQLFPDNVPHAFDKIRENNMAAREGTIVSTECTSSFTLPLTLSPRRPAENKKARGEERRRKTSKRRVMHILRSRPTQFGSGDKSQAAKVSGMSRVWRTVAALVNTYSSFTRGQTENGTWKRQRNENDWSTNILKKKRNKGEGYISTKGKNIPAHEMTPPCKETCRLQCHTKYTQDQRSLLTQQVSQRRRNGEGIGQSLWLGTVSALARNDFRKPRKTEIRMAGLAFETRVSRTGRGGLMVRLHASPLGKSDFRIWESCRTMPLVGGFSQISPVSPALALRCYSILNSLHPHRLEKPQR